MKDESDNPDQETTLRLGRLALERKLITPEQLRTALTEQARSLSERKKTRPLGEIFLEQGYLTNDQLRSLLEEVPAPGKDTPPHARLGKYEILRELGRGGMGVVYEAVDTELDRKVALKMMLGSPNADPKEAQTEEERFLREARLSAGLAKHPNIVSVYEAGILDGKRYLAMELVPGPSFSKWKKAGSVSIRQQVKVLRDVALGVHHAHKQGIIHRDLKPDNILIDVQNQPHVTDFGLAKSVGQNVQLSLTASGFVMGTPAYMSPEQAMGDKSIDRRTDVYALGVMLYESLTGRLPFTGETAIEILMKASKNPVPAPSSVVKVGAPPALDKTIENICLKSLAKRASDRYTTAEAFANDLTRWLKGEEVQVKVAAPERRKEPRREKSKVWIASGTVGVALLIVLFVAFSSSPPPADVELSPEARAREKREKAQREADRVERETLRRELDQARRDLVSAQKRAESAKTSSERERAAEEVRKAEEDQRKKEETLRKGKASADVAGIPSLGAPRSLLSKSPAIVRSVAFSADSKRCLSGCLDQKIKIWDVATGRLERDIVVGSGVVSVALRGPDEKVLASGNIDGTVKLWDADTGRAAGVLRGHSKAVNTVVFSPDGRLLVSQSEDPAIKIWDAKEGVVLRTVESARHTRIGAAFTADGKALALAVNDGEVRFQEVKSGAEAPARLTHSGLAWFSLSADGRILATVGWGEKVIKLYEPQTGRLLRKMAGPFGIVTTVAFSPDGKTLASGGEDGLIKLWDVATGKELRSYAGTEGSVMAIAFSPDGQWLGSAENSGMTLWPVRSR